MKEHKYSAQRTIVDGLVFPSKLEASVYQLLKLRERAGEIRDIKHQSTITLYDKCPTCGDGPLRWKVDFHFYDVKTGEKCYAEAKGAEGADYKKRKRAWKNNPPFRLEIWKGSHRNPSLVEVINPKKSDDK